MTNKADQARLDTLHNMECICCEIEAARRRRDFIQPNRTTAHHLVDKGNRELSGGHQATLPLCEWHHLGYRLRTHDFVDMEEKFGPSFARKKKLFIETYGTERYLLDLVNTKMGIAA